jgi:hypothetical protein
MAVTDTTHCPTPAKSETPMPKSQGNPLRGKTQNPNKPPMIKYPKAREPLLKFWLFSVLFLPGIWSLRFGIFQWQLLIGDWQLAIERLACAL